MLFDTHAHYDDEAFDPDRREVLAGLPQKGVGLVVDPGCPFRVEDLCLRVEQAPACREVAADLCALLRRQDI